MYVWMATLVRHQTLQLLGIQFPLEATYFAEFIYLTDLLSDLLIMKNPNVDELEFSIFYKRQQRSI